MAEDVFSSSDSVRSGKPLRHARSVTFVEPLGLELGGSLPEITVVYETYGALSPARDNAILICHAISGDSHVARHDAEDEPGWWDVVVGPGLSIDTSQYYVVCPNVLGGCRGTTGPGSNNPATGKPYGPDFPTITVGDMVEVQRRLLDHLGIQRLLAVAGGSMGGHQALSWAIQHPDRVRGAVLLATSARLTSQALAFDVVGRNAILRDPHFNGGEYYDAPEKPEVGLALARMIGHITYLSRQAMSRKFEAHRLAPRDVPIEFEKKFAVGSYLGYQGQKFVERFDANSYVTLSMAMDLFDLGATPGELAAALRPARCQWLVASFGSDWLFPPDQSVDLVRALVADEASVSFCNVHSTCGHDAFLLEDNLPTYGELVRAFLKKVSEAAVVGAHDGESPGRNPAHIFHSHRIDYDRILDLIPPGSSVLDLGCGRGGLLARLKERGDQRAVGVELDEHEIVTCVQRGLDVIQADLNHGLGLVGDEQFDFVVLSQTLQAVYDVKGLITEMLRVGRHAIVSFPNMAYRKHRERLVKEGRVPKGGALPHEWHSTPNIRFLSVMDFQDFCQTHRVRIHRQIALDTESDTEVFGDANVEADLVIMVLSRQSCEPKASR